MTWNLYGRVFRSRLGEAGPGKVDAAIGDLKMPVASYRTSGDHGKREVVDGVRIHLSTSCRDRSRRRLRRLGERLMKVRDASSVVVGAGAFWKKRNGHDAVGCQSGSAGAGVEGDNGGGEAVPTLNRGNSLRRALTLWVLSHCGLQQSSSKAKRHISFHA